MGISVTDNVHVSINGRRTLLLPPLSRPPRASRLPSSSFFSFPFLFLGGMHEPTSYVALGLIVAGVPIESRIY